jgi:hypothetical protein
LWHNWGKETERHINATLIVLQGPRAVGIARSNPGSDRGGRGREGCIAGKVGQIQVIRSE